ncbi:Cu(I)-responsive transcriptional regulator [Tahibacter aquaticus]|uniref:Cu(I)-responsive transcriptional regulator n=1 Tax=Tahibacter aquaticus TaxID=520092 RepID=A0A4R6Z208_9GAMM|nr:helix-turn-helix domain-containing protein [Tahibacter aquaticus]TDR45603.1 Cu(I)-responsive transcriptional regulator [Tahibacter aquaticus]
MNERQTIGQAATASGMPADNIRYYEKIGLVAKPSRTEGNYRTYGPNEVRRLGFIRRARELGFSIEQVREMLEMTPHHEQDCGRVDQLTHEHLLSIDRKIADLTALRHELEAMLTSCHGGTVRDCRILEAIAPSKSAVTPHRHAVGQAKI